MALIAMEGHVIFFSYFKPRPPLATDNPPDQTEQHVASRQCDEVPGEMALASDNGWGGFRVAKGGDRISATSLNYVPGLLSPKKLSRRKLVQLERPGNLVPSTRKPGANRISSIS
jgi:hypothetical protein